MREALAQNREIVAKLADIERRLNNHEADIGELVQAVRQLMTPPEPNRRKIGFGLPSHEQAANAHARVAV